MLNLSIPPKIALIANGTITDEPAVIARMRSFPFLVAVDGGVNHCYRLGVQPQLLIGDFDSADPSALLFFQSVPTIRFPMEKDQTDLELALEEVLKHHVEEIVIFGAMGGRPDHEIYNIILLSRLPGKLIYETSDTRMFVIDQKISLTCFPGQLISLIPLNGPACGITTKGLKWELTNATMDKQFMGISNIALQEHVEIQVKEGDLLCTIHAH